MLLMDESFAVVVEELIKALVEWGSAVVLPELSVDLVALVWEDEDTWEVILVADDELMLLKGRNELVNVSDVSLILSVDVVLLYVLVTLVTELEEIGALLVAVKLVV